jgi:ribonuclease D
VNALELGQFDGEVIMAHSKREVQDVLDILWKEEVIGFDTETKPSFRKGVKNNVSLVQMATPEQAFLIRLNHTGVTADLRDLMSSPKITKVGIALRDDLKDLQELSSFDPAGFVELNQLVKQIGIESNGLRKLAAIILGIRVSKSAQTSNWENEVLSEKQIRYAATDAWVCIEMYRQLVTRGFITPI